MPCCMQVLSSIVRRALKDNLQMQMAMDDQIATYINDAGTTACPPSLKAYSCNILLAVGDVCLVPEYAQIVPCSFCTQFDLGGQHDSMQLEALLR